MDWMLIFLGGGTVSFGVAVVWLAAFGGWRFGRKGNGGVLVRGGFGGVGDGEAFEPGNYIWVCLGKVGGWVWCWYG